MEMRLGRVLLLVLCWSTLCRSDNTFSTQGTSQQQQPCDIILATSNIKPVIYPSSSPVFSVHSQFVNPTDPECAGLTLEITWRCIDPAAAACKLADLQFPLTGVDHFVLPASAMEVNRPYTFRVVASAVNETSGVELSSTSSQWNVRSQWRPLVVDIAHQATVSPSNPLVLDGRLSYDPDGAIVTDPETYKYKWAACLWNATLNDCAAVQPNKLDGVLTISPVLQFAKFQGTVGQRWRFTLAYSHTPSVRASSFSVFVSIVDRIVPSISLLEVVSQPVNPVTPVAVRTRVFVNGVEDTDNSNQYQFQWSSNDVNLQNTNGVDSSTKDLLLKPGVLATDDYDIQLNIYAKNDTNKATSLQVYTLSLYLNNAPEEVENETALELSRQIVNSLDVITVETYMNAIDDDNLPLQYRYGYIHNKIEFPITDLDTPDQKSPWNMYKNPSPLNKHTTRVLVPLLPGAETAKLQGDSNVSQKNQVIQIFLEVRDALGAVRRILSRDITIENQHLTPLDLSASEILLTKVKNPLLQPYITPQNAAGATYLLRHWSETYIHEAGPPPPPSVPPVPTEPGTPSAVQPIVLTPRDRASRLLETVIDLLHTRVVDSRPTADELLQYETTIFLIGKMPNQFLAQNRRRAQLRQLLISLAETSQEDLGLAIEGLGTVLTSSVSRGEYQEVWAEYLRLIGTEVKALPLGRSMEITSGCTTNQQGECGVHTEIIKLRSSDLTSVTRNCGGASGQTQIRPQKRLIASTANSEAVGLLTSRQKTSAFQRFDTANTDASPEFIVVSETCSIVLLPIARGAQRPTVLQVNRPDQNTPQTEQNTVEIRFVLPSSNNPDVQCVFRNTTSGTWSTTGVKTEALGNVIKCTSDHLTDFSLRGRNAAVPAPPPVEPVIPGNMGSGDFTTNTDDDGGMKLLPWVIGVIIVGAVICIVIIFILLVIHCFNIHQLARRARQHRIEEIHKHPKKKNPKHVHVQPNHNNMQLIPHPEFYNDETLFTGVPMPGLDDKNIQVTPTDNAPYLEGRERKAKSAAPLPPPEEPDRSGRKVRPELLDYPDKRGEADFALVPYTSHPRPTEAGWLWPQEIPSQEAKIAKVTIQSSPRAQPVNPLATLDRGYHHSPSNALVLYEPPTHDAMTSPPPQYIQPYAAFGYPNNSSPSRAPAYFPPGGMQPPPPPPMPIVEGGQYPVPGRPPAMQPANLPYGTQRMTHGTAPMVVRTRSPHQYGVPQAAGGSSEPIDPVAANKLQHLTQLAGNKLALVRPQLGLQLLTEPDASGTDVVVISGLNANGPLGHLPIQIGDRLLNLGTTPIKDKATFVSTLGSMYPGTMTTLTVLPRHNAGVGPQTHTVVVGAQISCDDHAFLHSATRGEAGPTYGLHPDQILEKVKSVDTTREMAVPWPPTSAQPQ